MKHDKIAQLRALLPIVERSTPQILEDAHGARFEFRAGAYEMRLAGIAGTSTMSREAARDSWLRAVRRRIARVEDVCVDVYSPWGSGPVPIERREG